MTVTKERVRSEGDALLWLAECTLATVDSLRMKAKPPKGELARQISIAQTAVDWIRSFRIDPGKSRVADVIACGGSVEDWIRRS